MAKNEKVNKEAMTDQEHGELRAMNQALARQDVIDRMARVAPGVPVHFTEPVLTGSDQKS